MSARLGLITTVALVSAGAAFQFLNPELVGRDGRLIGVLIPIFLFSGLFLVLNFISRRQRPDD